MRSIEIQENAGSPSPELRQRLPDFMIIGAPKAGTTWLFSALCRHPDIYPAFFKETHFFSTDSEFAKGLDFYSETYFSDSSSYRLRGEATPAYLRKHEKVIPRLQQTGLLKSLKLIVVLRDPVERCWSHYLHRRRSLNETLEFEHALDAEDERLANGEDFAGYVQCGLYASQLQHWLAAIGKNQLLVVRHDRLMASPRQELDRIIAFLALDKSDAVYHASSKNEAGEPRFDFLMRYLRSDTSFSKQILKRWMPAAIRRELKTRIRQLNVKRYSTSTRPVMTEATRQRLRQRFTPDIEKLEVLIQQDLSDWKHTHSPTESFDNS